MKHFKVTHSIKLTFQYEAIGEDAAQVRRDALADGLQPELLDSVIHEENADIDVQELTDALGGK